MLQQSLFIATSAIMIVLALYFVWRTPYKEGKVTNDGLYCENAGVMIDPMGNIILSAVFYNKHEYYI